MQDNEAEKTSKTQLKKEMLALQKLGEDLINLSDSQLAKIPLSTELLDAIHFARALKTHESKRRHLQYIGKLMRKIDPEPIKIALKKIQLNDEVMTSQFHEIEKWRDQLIAEGDIGLQKFMKIYPDADRQHLRQLIRKAKQDDLQQKNTGSKTELFRYLRELFQNS